MGKDWIRPVSIEGKSYLVAVDYFSRWIEIEKLSISSSNAVISKLKVMFARWGLPNEIRSDGGP